MSVGLAEGSIVVETAIVGVDVPEPVGGGRGLSGEGLTSGRPGVVDGAATGAAVVGRAGVGTGVMVGVCITKVAMCVGANVGSSVGPDVATSLSRLSIKGKKSNLSSSKKVTSAMHTSTRRRIIAQQHNPHPHILLRVQKTVLFLAAFSLLVLLPFLRLRCWGVGVGIASSSS